MFTLWFHLINLHIFLFQTCPTVLRRRVRLTPRLLEPRPQTAKQTWVGKSAATVVLSLVISLTCLPRPAGFPPLRPPVMISCVCSRPLLTNIVSTDVIGFCFFSEGVAALLVIWEPVLGCMCRKLRGCLETRHFLFLWEKKNVDFFFYYNSGE